MVTETKPRRRLVTQGNPDFLYPVPDDKLFGEDAYAPDDTLGLIATALMRTHSELGALIELSITYLWKRQGGKSKGNTVYGKCVKPGDLDQFLTGYDFVVWLAADHCRDSELTNWQIEALVYHELSHAFVNEDGKAKIIGHDYAGFVRELVEYGPWSSALQRAAQVLQPGLPGMEE